VIIAPQHMTLREVKDTDHEWLVELHNDPNVLYNLTNPSPITHAQHMDWWENISGDSKQLRLVFEVNGQRMGFTKFYDIDRTNMSCVLGADIHSTYRGRGLAKYMWALMLNKCFCELGMYRVSLTTAEYNVIGQRVYTGLGFKEEGRLTQSLRRSLKHHDQIMMYMLRPDWEAK
jgi:RimJ/RimL family protein N-acetyltransferase